MDFRQGVSVRRAAHKTVGKKTGRMRKKRRNSGQFAELIARMWLRAHGWRILGHRVRTPMGELDIVARRGRQLVFVEVKQRRTLEEAALALLPQQQRRIGNAARCWLAQHPHLATLDARCDLIAVNRHGLLRHYRNAFEVAER